MEKLLYYCIAVCIEQLFALSALWAITSFLLSYARKFVVTKDNLAYLYHAPGKKREFNAFVLDKTYYGPYDETTCIDWTDDSKWVV